VDENGWALLPRFDKRICPEEKDDAFNDKTCCLAMRVTLADECEALAAKAMREIQKKGRDELRRQIEDTSR
jgi:hypothetical protein